ncbi:MAG: phosphate transporter permease subunit PstC [Actinomycetota bacterium]|jgi:phosphate transport system permease protein
MPKLSADLAPVAATSESFDRPREIKHVWDAQDQVFRMIMRSAGSSVLVIMALVGLFLALRASQAIETVGLNFFTTQAWEPDSANFGIAAVITGTVIIALIAIFVAVPFSLGTALYISEYAPRRLKRILITLVDLMAAIPSVVFGLWGFFFLQNEITPVAKWISKTFGWIPFLSVQGSDPNDPLTSNTIFTSSSLIAGIVVGLMITPIVTSVMREVFSQAPIGEREAALGLGSTRWGMVRNVVLSFGKGGIIGATMLGLGRALGETIAVYMIISPVFVIQPRILENGANSVSSLIALRYGEATQMGMSALMAAGLALFVLTLIVNFVASSIVSRSRSGASS